MKIAKFLISPAAALLKGVFKKPEAPPAPRQATRADARDQALRNDELLRRRGGAADMVTGSYGAEAPAGATGKTLLGS